MNFRAILFGADPAQLDAWLPETNASGPHHIRSFAQFMPIEGGALRLRQSQLMAASQVNAADVMSVPQPPTRGWDRREATAVNQLVIKLNR
jgi:hypothetical protein